jgi:hypothetical protein
VVGAFFVAVHGSSDEFEESLIPHSRGYTMGEALLDYQGYPHLQQLISATNPDSPPGLPPELPLARFPRCLENLSLEHCENYAPVTGLPDLCGMYRLPPPRSAP